MPMPKEDRPDEYRCPGCKTKREPVATDETHDNTDGISCRVFKCPNEECDYREGRPIEGDAV